MRRNPHDPLARRQQRLLEAPGDMPAVLDRPHPLLVQAARPPDRGQMPWLISLDLSRPAHTTGPPIDSRQRMRPLVRVRPDHDHMTVPSFG